MTDNFNVYINQSQTVYTTDNMSHRRGFNHILTCSFLSRAPLSLVPLGRPAFSSHDRLPFEKFQDSCAIIHMQCHLDTYYDVHQYWSRAQV